MAKLTVPNLDKYSAKLASISRGLEGICKYACYDAADMAIKAVKAACPVSDDPRSKGDLRESFILTPYKNEGGFVYTRIGVTGYDRKGQPNLEIVRSLESGRSTPDGKVVGKHEFIRKAIQSVKKSAEASIEKNLDKKLEEIMKE